MARSKTANSEQREASKPSRLPAIQDIDPKVDVAAPGESIVEDDDPLDMDATDVFTDNVGDQSVEINVEGLIAELETDESPANRSEILTARRKLENYLEERRFARQVEDFEDYDVED
jgi:hypothetical protein